MNSSNPPSDESDPRVRLQKVLAAAGFGSRRKCEALIDAGRVSVDGQLVVAQGTRVDPAVNIIRVDDQRIAVPSGTVVLALNKPLGVLTAMSDDRGRRCVGDVVDGSEFGGRFAQLFHVGRLDSETDGLLLLTNDGDLAHLLTHPSFGVDKTYVAGVEGQVRPVDLKKLRAGVVIDDRPVRVSRVRVRDANPHRSLVELTIHEGRKHIVRRLLAEIGFPVQTLTRTRFGPIALSGLPAGAIRELAEEEVTSLYDAAEQSGQGSKAPGGR